MRRSIGGLLLLAAVITGAMGVRSRMAGASASPYAPVDVPNLTLGQPQAPARLNSSAVLSIVKGKLNPALFAHPYTVRYGSFDLSDVALRLNGPSSAPQALGVRDVWEVTISGLRIERPCASGVAAKCPPPVSTLAVFVDDKLGQVIESEGY